tara:strand:+ start:361 stop:840 length:480 start_codon:yes stop_codon:yes gene_type:complete
MKPFHGYLILFVSFFGLIYLQYYVDSSSTVIISDFHRKQNPDYKMKNRIERLEEVIDSLVATDIDVPTINNPTDKIPILSPTPQVIVVESKSDYRMKDLFTSLNDAAKVRDSQTKLSLIAQDYINLAYKMGGDDWYGAEKIWDTEAFKLRAMKLHQDDG